MISLKFKNAFINNLEKSQFMLEDFLFKCANRLKPKYFSRESKMGFKETMLFILNMEKKTIQLELNNFFDKILKRDDTISKQAYLEARQKIDPKAFIELNDVITNNIYNECEDIELWNGFRLSGIDGSIFEIPDTKALREEFGSVKNQNREVARAKAATIFDLLNKITIKSQIANYKKSERKMATEMIQELINDEVKNDLILFDRGFPSVELFSYLIDNGINFLMRAAKNYSNQIINAKKEDQIISMKYNQNTYQIRVVRFLLSSGEEEILLTTLLDEKYSVAELKKLYFIRWQTEINYDVLKNRLEIENFTSNSKVAIEQDFYATIYLSNMAELARKQSDDIVETRNKGKENKLKYKTNTNILIGTLKDEFILLLLEPNKRKRNKKFMKIMNLIAKSVVPIRSERQNPRKERISRGKYKANHKRCL